MGYVLDSVKIN